MSGPRILAIAYVCMPGVGSEPGTGFAWARILAGIGETWILTRPWPARRAELEAAVAAAPEGASIHLEYVDLPRWAGTSGWDPFTRGHQRLEYILWQLAALRTARRLARRQQIDLVWHLTFANVWMGSIGALVGPRSILGPVGGGVGPPWRLMAGSGVRSLLGEGLRSGVRTVARYLNPLARVAWSRATLILAQNAETLAWLPSSARRRTVVFHHVALEEQAAVRTRQRGSTPPVAIFAGRLLPWKGVGLALRAIAQLDGWRLIITGSGPQEQDLRALAATLGIADRVEFRGWVARHAVLAAMRDEADVMLFPSLHEEGGWAVGEAIAMGLPVVCLDRGGPPLVGGVPVAAGSEAETVRGLAAAARRVVEDPPPPPPPPLLDSRRAGLVAILRQRGLG
ncbi:MAG TPA: glycosyltransferase [Candidatus Sulfotelmatobacter sp.]|nr:glycosyltransferase [Candidatus Sulfotelmatobacter sp.]